MQYIVIFIVQYAHNLASQNTMIYTVLFTIIYLYLYQLFNKKKFTMCFVFYFEALLMQ